MPLKELTPRQVRCGKILLNCIAEGKYKIEYNQLSAQAGVPLIQIGAEIGELSKHCHQLGLPLISVIVVNKETQICGEGFFNLCNELHAHPEFEKKMKKMFDICMQEVKDCTEWHRFAEYMGTEAEGLHTPGKPVRQEAPEPAEEVLQTERTEGKLIQVTSSAYERDAALRAECLRIHGTSCKICGFDAALVYGKEFAGRIHVQHITPLAEVRTQHTVSPETDLIPVCPNCHMILHAKKDGVWLPEEVRNMLKKNRKNNL